MEHVTDITTILALLLATARAAGVLLVAPPFGAAAVPVRLRVAMALVLGVAVLGRLLEPLAVPADGARLLAAVAMELAMGLVIGLGVRLIFTGMAIGAWHVAQQLGIGLGEAVNPADSQAGGPVQRLFVVGAIAVFVLLDGHVDLAAALLGTFETLPPGRAIAPAGLLPMIVGLLGSSFLLALKVAAPVLLALIVTSLVLGTLQRSVPQLHVFNAGLPLRSILGLLVLGGAIAAIVPLTDRAWRSTQTLLTNLSVTGGLGT
jgi:flagellar biosynthetic protein FliR